MYAHEKSAAKVQKKNDICKTFLKKSHFNFVFAQICSTPPLYRIFSGSGLSRGQVEGKPWSSRGQIGPGNALRLPWNKIVFKRIYNPFKPLQTAKNNKKNHFYS